MPSHQRPPLHLRRVQLESFRSAHPWGAYVGPAPQKDAAVPACAAHALPCLSHGVLAATPAPEAPCTRQHCVRPSCPGHPCCARPPRTAAKRAPGAYTTQRHPPRHPCLWATARPLTRAGVRRAILKLQSFFDDCGEDAAEVELAARRSLSEFAAANTATKDAFREWLGLARDEILATILATVRIA